MMFDTLPEAAWPVLAGVIGGIPLGLAARIGRFCTLGALEDALYAHDNKRLRMWAVALGVALLSVTLIELSGLSISEQTMYHRLDWHPLASISGGLIFGYGMAMAGNCGYGALARLGGGDMRAFVIVLVIGISAFITISGPLAALREGLFPTQPATSVQGFASGLAAFGIPVWATGVGAALLMLGIAFYSAEFRSQPKFWFWGAVVGLAIASGVMLTAWIAEHSFDAVVVEGHSFTAPLGDSLLYLMTSSGGGAGFGVGSVVGVLFGAILGALWKGHFRWEGCEDPRELQRQIMGGALMGVGGVVAMGCSVGQGLTGFATLAYAAPVTLLSIFAGGALGLRYLVTGFMPR